MVERTLSAVTLLSLFLAAVRRLDRWWSSWLVLSGLVALGVPFSWELWIRSIEIDTAALRWIVRLLLLPAMFLYFLVGLRHVRRTACAALVLCALSFAGHAGLFVSADPSRDADTDLHAIEMDRKTNIHVIMLDSFTHSSFSKEFMDVENPAADHLSTLDDAIHAGAMGFSEKVPTRYAWASLFELDRTDGVVSQII